MHLAESKEGDLKQLLGTICGAIRHKLMPATQNLVT